MKPFTAVCVIVLCAWCTPVALAAANRAPATEPPVIPVGLDAFRMWDRWAYLRIGQRTYMTSTYDRRGANEAADASHFLYQLADDRNVTLDVAGPGVLAFKRTNHWHGSPWHYIVDGRDYVVSESSTPDPDNPLPGSVFIPEAQFPHPLTWTWSITHGADLNWVPIPFERSFTLAYGRTHYGTGYYIYHRFLPDAPNLSQPIESWDMDVPSNDVLEIIRRSGTDIAPRGGHIREYSGRLDLAPRQTVTLADLSDAPATLRALHITVDEPAALALGRTFIRITWDDCSIPSVDVPVSLFFGAGTLYNRDHREYLVRAFPVNIRYADGKVHLAMYFPMPFMKRARLELIEKEGVAIPDIAWSIRAEPYSGAPNAVGHFHATYVDHGTPEPGRDLVFLDTRQAEGGGDWCGHFVGTAFIFSDRAVLHTLEGDPRFYFDDSNSPQAQGTGTEEWGGGGDYWGGRNMTLPFAGHPVGCRSPKDSLGDEDLIQSAYRFLLSDLMPFGKNARITFEHGGENNSEEHYRSVTFWYGLNQPCLILTDTLDVGEPEDEARHDYDSPTASSVQTLRSRYEWGIDNLHGKELYPETTDHGRYMKGTTTFTLKLDPANIGVMLRRTLDYAWPNQCARVFVADVGEEAPWQEVGTWYTAGSNTVVFSNPPAEKGPPLHIVQTSNRRWRDDEFLLPRTATQGRSAIRVRIDFVPREIRLLPGWPLTEQAWTEYRYQTYCFVMPGLRDVVAGQ